MSELLIHVLNQSLSASVVVCIVTILRFLLKESPKWIHVFLWSFVAIRLLCPISIESPFSLIPDSLGSGAFLSEWLDDYVGEISMIHDNSVTYDAAVAAGRVPIYDGNGGYYVVTKFDQLGEPDTIQNTIVPILTIIWAAGIALLIGYMALSVLRLKHSVRTAIPYQKNLYLCELIGSPLVFGILRPNIYLPFNLNDRDLDHVIAHERAHIARKDHWWKPLGFLILTIHWFNPLMWLAYRSFCRDIELACDEKVIRSLDHEQRADYAQALLNCSIGQRTVVASPLAFGEIGVKERIRSVMYYKKPRFWAIIGSLTVCIACAVCFLTNPEGMAEKLSDFNLPPTTIDTVNRDQNDTNEVMEHSQDMASDHALNVVSVQEHSPVYDIQLELIDRKTGQPLAFQDQSLTVEPEEAVGSLAYSFDPENPHILELRFWCLDAETPVRFLIEDLEYSFEVPPVTTSKIELNRNIAYNNYTATIQNAVFYPRAVALQFSDISDRKLLEEYCFLTVNGKKYLPFTRETEAGNLLLYLCETDLTPEMVQSFTIGKNDEYVVDLAFE